MKLDPKIKKKMIAAIWKSTHKDYRGSKGKSIMPPFSVYNTTTIVDLEKIPDEELKQIYEATPGMKPLKESDESLKSFTEILTEAQKVYTDGEVIPHDIEWLKARKEKGDYEGRGWYAQPVKKLFTAIDDGKKVSFKVTEPTKYGGILVAIVDGKDLALTKKKVKGKQLSYYLTGKS